MLDSNHLPGSDKRVRPLRGSRGSLPGQTLVVYDPYSDLAVDLVAGENAYARAHAGPYAPGWRCPSQVWVADRHFCTRAWLQGLVVIGSHFLVRQHLDHPRQSAQGA